MLLNEKKIKLSKKELERLAETLKKRELKKINKKTEKEVIVDENKFIERNIKLEKISPVLKPVAEAPILENIASSFPLKKEIEKTEKPYEFGEQKYSSQSSEYKTLNKIQNENLQTPARAEKGITHMGTEQSTKRKSERFFDDSSEKEYKNFMYDKSE
ncbi:MAG: hypothetical protein Q8O84_02930 [Nanoarchaeota archaeon]|nr:hypothetical protein [Nanoarchaeota archaeon]